MKALLDSDDIEMVKIGIMILREIQPRELWPTTLEMFSFAPVETVGPELYIRKWQWKIFEDGSIVIHPLNNKY